MKRKYVATFSYNGRTHAIRHDWSYDRIGQARTLCGIRGPFAIEHSMRKRTKVTCRNCERLVS